MNKIKQSRPLSFLAVALVYVLSALLGFYVYQKLNLVWWLALLVADVLATALTFVFGLIFRNASVYDPYWSVQPPVIVIGFAFSYGFNLQSLLMLAMIGFWSVRLTANWAYTFSNLTHQDWRYTMLSQTTGKLYPLVNFIGIHMVPTLVVYLCTLPAVYAMIEKPEANFLSISILLLSFLAVIIQQISDMEMHSYRKNRTSPFIKNGLWKYSRHPNYLGEILMWWGIGLSLAFSAPEAWYLLSGAAANTLLFLTVSIPLADRRQAKKEGFSEYKEQTRMLLPIRK